MFWSSDDHLDENETATLWSKEPNECSSDGSLTAMQTLVSCTDVTFSEPPETAERWTALDFESLSPGGHDTARYPEHADRTDSGVIADAHATVFAIQPSTWVH
ncbi:hypothetical protein GCM10025298_07540 [Natronobiforma cellulositropha]